MKKTQTTPQQTNAAIKKLETLGDYRCAARESLHDILQPWTDKQPKCQNNTNYDAIKIGLIRSRDIIAFSRSQSVAVGTWEAIYFPNTRYEMINYQLFECIQLMEFAIAYAGQSFDNLFPKWPKRPDVNAMVFTTAGISFLEATFKFVREIGMDIAGILQNAYRQHRDAGRIIYAYPLTFLDKNPVDTLAINPEPDIIIKTWFDNITTGFQKYFPESEFSWHKLTSTFNSVQNQIEYEWGVWEKSSTSGTAGSKTNSEIPSDLIDLAKAVSLYHRSRAQIKRDINDGKINDYRKLQNGKHWLSKKEADNLYISK